MIRCPTCGQEWSPGTPTCPKDGTRLSGDTGRHAVQTVLTEAHLPEDALSTLRGGEPTGFGEPTAAALGDAVAPPTTTEAPAVYEPRPSFTPQPPPRRVEHPAPEYKGPGSLPPEPRSGGRQHVPVGARPTGVASAPPAQKPGSLPPAPVLAPAPVQRAGGSLAPQVNRVMGGAVARSSARSDGRSLNVAEQADESPPVAERPEHETARPRPSAPRAAPRPSGPKPAPLLQPLPVAVPPPGAKNPWEDSTDTLKRTHDTPKTQVGPPSDPKDPLIGVRLGEYTVLEQLGAGGMGIVYRGEQPLIGKQVAIKVLRPELANDPRQVQRLVDEARAVNAVHHPGLINIFSFGETPEGAKYFVMDLLEGQSLEALLHARGRLKAWEAVPILEGALSALDAAHSAGVIHRDLKPSNIFLVDLPDHTHLVKLLDFGLAKLGAAAYGSTPQTMNVVVGTPEYMAPEQARAHDISPRTDVYAMGIVAYELLTGDVPFSCESAVETLMMQLDVVPKAPSELEPSIPEQLEKLVMRMLAKKPEDRPASASEVKRELLRIKRHLTNAETQVAVRAVPANGTEPALPDLSGTGGPPPAVVAAPAPAAVAPKLSPLPPSVQLDLPSGAKRFDTTDVMAPVDEKLLDERPQTDRTVASTDPTGASVKPWLVPALIGAALVSLLAFGYVMLFRSKPADDVVAPPPPKELPKPRGETSPAPSKEEDEKEAVAASGQAQPAPPQPAPKEGAQQIAAKKHERAAPPPAHPAKKAVRPHTRAEVDERMVDVAEEGKKRHPGLTDGFMAELKRRLDKGQVTPDEAWAELDRFVEQLK